MKSFQEWRKQPCNEITLAANAEAIIAGLPTIDSVVEQIFGHSKVPPYVPTMFKSVGNDDYIDFEDEFEFDPKDIEEPDGTAPSTNNGGLVKYHSEKADKNIIPKNNNTSEIKIGLGELGMKKVSDATFGNSNISHAGEAPTISQGIPVGGFQEQFESFENYRKKLERWKTGK